MSAWLQRFITRKRRAAVLVLTLWMVVVLGVIATTLAFDIQVNSKLALLQKEQLIAYNLAKSAIALGMTHLQNDMLIDFAENPNQQFDAMSDVWAQPDRRDKDKEVKLGKGTYQLEIEDEESKININVASQRLLKAMLEYYGYEPPDSDDIANAIVDWRDRDDICVGAAGEKENEHYSALLGQRIKSQTTADELIYQCRNEPFLTIDELQDVYGITPELFYGFDPKEREAAEKAARDRVALGKRAIEKKLSRYRRQPKPLRDIITVRGNGRVNLNTASVEVLTILAYAANNCTNMEAAEAAAESIVQFRGDPEQGKRPDPDNAFHSLADLAKVPGLNAGTMAQLSAAGALGVQIGFRSSTFLITGIGRVGNTTRMVRALVSRNLDTYNPEDARLLSNKGKIASDRRRGSFAGRRLGRQREAGGGQIEDNLIRIPAIRVLQWME
ncbi:MAG: general secretion pathway protein GspK [Candidatus Sumerlaeaceae bacterium]|nr:general secretion pathway protein GspK [Candidatus Sumerlaeaceae bacterium]